VKNESAAWRKKVLVLDNDESMRTVMSFFLGRAGYVSYLTEDRDEALEGMPCTGLNFSRKNVWKED